MENTKPGGGVLMRRRNVSESAPQEPENPKTSPESSGFTALNESLERRRYELLKQLTQDKSAAESELARLERRCELLREFLMESDSAAETLEELKAVIHAEKEFSVRISQLELRCCRARGKYREGIGGNFDSASAARDSAPPRTMERLLYEALPMILGMIVASLIVAGAMALIFL